MQTHLVIQGLFVLALSAGCASSSPTVTSSPPPADLVVELEYRSSMEPLPRQGRGRLMGSGVGRTSGALDGEVRWSLYEVQGATSCELHMLGTITDDGGGTVEFQAIGFGNRPSPTANVWDMTASAEFTGDTQGGSHLSGRVAAWVGRFDAATGRHLYHVHFPSERSDL